jgi:Tol biopolymer transport system component
MPHSRDRDRGLSGVHSLFPLRVRSSILCVLVVLGVGMAQAAGGASSPTRWIVFSALPNGLAPAQLFRIQTTGAGIQQITKGKYAATDPAFSPDGKRVVFARLGSGIFVVSLDGSGLHKLTSGARDIYPVWSPKGTHIAFLRHYKNQWRLYVMTPSGRALHRLRLAPPAGRPSWTADGKSIFIPARGSLEKIDARTGRSQRHVQFTVDLPISSTVAPNSRNVAFFAPRPSISGCGDVSCIVFALYLADVSRVHVRKFVNDGSPAGWSPDGKQLVFVYRGALVLWPVGSGARTTLTTGSNVAQADAPPAWQPR